MSLRYVMPMLFFCAIELQPVQGVWKLRYTSKYELAFYHIELKFVDAEKACRDRNSRLVKIDEPGITNVIDDAIDSTKEYWIGATDLVNEDKWVWPDGTPAIGSGAAYKNWASGEPNNQFGEDCAVVGYYSKKWTDIDCGYSCYFICQRDIPFSITSGDSVLTFYMGFSSTQTVAKASCAHKDSRLVEITSKELNEAIQRETSSEYWYWTGGNDIDEEGAWKWNDGQRIDQQADKFWHTEPPRWSRNSNCLATSSGYWNDVQCSNELRYICEQVKAHKIAVSDDSVSISDEPPPQLRCSGEGYPVPRVAWYRRGSAISWTATNSVHQIRGTGSSALDLTHANISSSDEYICAIRNAIKGQSYQKQTAITVTVSGNPHIVSTKSQNCSKTVLLLWKASSRAIGFEHRVIANDTILTRITPSEEQASISTELNVLSPFTNYIIKVTACKDTNCHDGFDDSRSIVTGGRPNAVSSVELRMSTNNKTCRITWNPPAMGSASGIIKYNVKFTSTVVRKREDATPEPKIDWQSAPKEKSEMDFEMKPNRKYAVEVQVENCAGVSNAAYSRGTCESATAAPAYLVEPKLAALRNDDGTWSLNVRRPDETNGLVSCLFIMVDPADSGKESIRNFSLGDLRRAASRNDGSSMYIAIAIPVTSMLSKAESGAYKLGTGDETSCDIVQISGGGKRRRRAASEGEYRAKNLKLEEDKTYRFQNRH